MSWKAWLIAILIAALLGWGFWWAWNKFFVSEPESQLRDPNSSASEKEGTENIPTQSESKSIAERWVREKSPTFTFDGTNLEIGSQDILGPGHYRFTFSFQSRQAGYGNREGQMLAQVITDHVLIVEVRDGKVTRAVTDGQFDELTGKMLFDPKVEQKG